MQAVDGPNSSQLEWLQIGVKTNVDHQFTSIGEEKWAKVPGTEVKGLVNIVAGTPFSLAEHASMPEHVTVLSEWRSSISGVPELRYSSMSFFERPHP